MASDRLKSIFIVAGEASGDLHGAALIQEILKRDSSLYVWGIGGDAMKTAGVELVAHSSDLAVTGLLEVFLKLRKIFSLFSLLLKKVELQRPSLAILIDYPDFNLRLAKKLHQKNIPVLYYISPQVWAWRKRRVYLIRKWITKMLVVFPFEVPFYQRYGVKVDFVGHPLLGHVQPTLRKDEAQNHFGLDPQKKTIGLLPGSRKNEIQYLLKPMIEAATKIYKENSQTQFLLPVASTLSLSDTQSFLKGVTVPIHCVQGKFYDALNVCDVAMCCSGTATLEMALFGKPMVILYKLNWMSHLLGRVIIRYLPFFGMPNIILGKKVVPELLQSQVTGENIAKEILHYLNSPELLQKTSEELLQVKQKLGTQGATKRVADHVLELLNKEVEEKLKRKLFNIGMIVNLLQTRYRFPLRGKRARAQARSFIGQYQIASELASGTSLLKPCPLAFRDGLQENNNHAFVQYPFIVFRPHVFYWAHKIFSPLLWIASLVYRFGLETRKFLYHVGIFKSRSVSAKVISIGNIAIGGTGKTPLTMHIAQELEKQGKKVVILSRGYKRKSKTRWDCVSEGSGPRLSPSEVGDEPWLMASKHPRIPIYVGANRYHLAQEVMRQRPVDIFLLDDGFQHWKLKRNTDVVTIDVTRFQKNKALLPLGFFREPLSHLKRAQCFVLVRTDHLGSFEKEEILETLYRVHPYALVVEANYQPQYLQHVVSKQLYSLSELSEKKVFAFAGIGNPQSFKKTIQDLKGSVVGFQSYLDHWSYSLRDMEQLVKKFSDAHAELFLTTEKDAARLSQGSVLGILKDIPIYALGVDLKITQNDHLFKQFLQTI